MVNEKALNKNRIVCALLIVMASLVAISFILLPVETDIKVFLGNARLAEGNTQYNWLTRSLKTWELKGVGNRTIFLCMGALASLFFKYASVAFMIASKLIYFIGAAVAVALSTFWQKNKKRVFCIVIIILFMCGIECHMQAEMSSVIVMILAYGLFSFKDKMKFSFMAGLFFGTVFFIKSATIIMILAFVALAIYFKKKDIAPKRLLGHIVWLGAGAVAIIALGLVLIQVIYPTEISDMLDASKFQTSLLSGGVSVKAIIVQFAVTFAKSSIRMIPMLIAVVASVIYIIVKWIKTKKAHMAFLLIAFIVPALYVVVLNSYFSYHYYLFVFPLAILLSSSEINEKSSKKDAIISGTIFGVIFVLFVAFGFVASPSNIRFIKTENKVESKNKEALKLIDKNDGVILYLDSGVGSYILGQKSYSKYYYPLPIQRKKIAAEKQPAYKNMVKDIDSYHGKYITYEKTYMEKDGNIVSKEKSIKNLLEKYNHKVTTLYYAPNIDLSPSSEDDLIYSIDVYERKK